MSKPALLGGKPMFPASHRWPKWPVITPADRKRVVQAMENDQWGIGSATTAEFSKRFAEYLGVRYVLPTNTGTAALELIVKALGIGPGDEILVPAYTFVASATCALEVGASVIFADVDPHTFNLDPASVEKLITPRTKAIIAVHFGGNPADLMAIKRVIGKRKIAIIEDAAHAHGMLYRGKPPGHGSAAAEFSFQSSKNMNCGEGGALATNNAKLYEMASSFHSFGRRKGKPWYAHYYLAWNHRITALQSAVLLGELERLEKQTITRAANGALLNAGLSHIAGQSPQIDGDTYADTRRAFHVYLWRYDAKQVGLDRDTFMEALKAEGVDCFGGYPLPLQEAPMFTQRRYWHGHRHGGGPKLPGEPNYRAMRTPVAKQLCKEAVWLSHNYLLSGRKEMQGIVDAVARIVEHAPELKKAMR